MDHHLDEGFIRSQKADCNEYISQLETTIKMNDLPNHIAIIMDGNRRYAKEVLNDSTLDGHYLGKEKLKSFLHWCLDLGIQHITVFAFSTENYSRERKEIDYLMGLIEESLYLVGDDDVVHQFGVKIRIIGNRDILPESVVRASEYAEERTRDYNNHTLNVAIAYGGRQDIVNAVKGVAKDLIDGKISIDDIDEAAINERISTYGIPDPDLILRTSGEMRVSNFLLWQMAYSELYFTEVYWPGFDYADLLEAIQSYQRRRRRYGK